MLLWQYTYDWRNGLSEGPWLIFFFAHRDRPLSARKKV
jgi:hypothetical protein